MMRVVLALGGNALLQRGQPMTQELQRKNVRLAAEQIARIAPDSQLIITHGNGPQVGLLALQAYAGDALAAFPLDVLGAETEGSIGYMIEQELGNALPTGTPLATLLTQVEVDLADPAFNAPSKPIGPSYTQPDAEALRAARGWAIAQDGKLWRRVVPSPRPQKILELRPVSWLLAQGAVVICAGGGGIPVVRGRDGKMHGIEAVIDKDYCSSLLARELKADLLIIATDVHAVQTNWGTPEPRSLSQAHPDFLEGLAFASGSMGPKVLAACEFARATGKSAVIGSLKEIELIIRGRAGTRVSTDVRAPHYYR